MEKKKKLSKVLFFVGAVSRLLSVVALVYALRSTSMQVEQFRRFLGFSLKDRDEILAATGKLLSQQGLMAADIDLFEIHEAFAATVVKCRRDLDIPDEKLNVNGGVIALGHPLGATGAKPDRPRPGRGRSRAAC